MNPRKTIPARRRPPEDPEKGGEDFTAPLGSSRNGPLRFTNGAHRITIRADLYVQGLYRARFGDWDANGGVAGRSRDQPVSPAPVLRLAQRLVGTHGNEPTP
jgi:hypothetical protein